MMIFQATSSRWVRPRTMAVKDSGPSEMPCSAEICPYPTRRAQLLSIQASMQWTVKEHSSKLLRLHPSRTCIPEISPARRRKHHSRRKGALLAAATDHDKVALL